MQIAKTLDVWEKDIQEGKKHGLIGAIKIGRALKAIKDGNLWLPSGCQSFEQYCEGTHGFKKSTGYAMIGVWDTWGEYLLQHPELQGVDITRLFRLLPHVDDKNPQDLLTMAATVPDKAGFEANLRNMDGKTAPDQCEQHDFQPLGILQCTVCGLRKKVNENPAQST
jgi:hypothetical protein